MQSKRVQARLQKTEPPLRAAFAFAEVVEEAMMRRLGDGGCPAPESGPGTRALFLALGRGIQEQREALRSADEVYQRLRARQRSRLKRRDASARRLYLEVVASRRLFKGLFGPKGADDYFGLRGETPRQAWHLHALVREAVIWARSREAAPAGYWANAAAQAARRIDSFAQILRD